MRVGAGDRARGGRGGECKGGARGARVERGVVELQVVDGVFSGRVILARNQVDIAGLEDHRNVRRARVDGVVAEEVADGHALAARNREDLVVRGVIAPRVRVVDDYSSRVTVSRSIEHGEVEDGSGLAAQRHRLHVEHLIGIVVDAIGRVGASGSIVVPL